MRPTFLLVDLILLFYVTHTSAFQHNQTQASVKSSSINQSETCNSQWSNCKRDPNCKKLFNKVKRKCSVEGPRCNLNSKKVSQCFQKIEALISKNFPRTCFCPKRRIQINELLRCANIFNLIHSNPCYDAGLKLRNNLEKRKHLNNDALNVTKAVDRKNQKASLTHSNSVINTKTDRFVPDSSENTQSTKKTIKNPKNNDMSHSKKKEVKAENEEVNYEEDYEELTEEELEELDRFFAPEIIHRGHHSPSSIQQTPSTTTRIQTTRVQNQPKSPFKLSTDRLLSSGDALRAAEGHKQSYQDIGVGVGIGVGILIILLAMVSIIFYVYKATHKVKYTRGRENERSL